MPQKQKTFADFIQEQAKRLDPTKFVYSSIPYSCGLLEAYTHTKQFAYPVKFEDKTTDEKNTVIIEFPPRKGSGKRKKLTLTLWVA